MQIMRRMLNWLSRKRFPYKPLIGIYLSKSRLLHNLREFRKLIPHGAVVPVLKSNAYGHGLMEAAGMLKDELHIPFFVIDSYFEAVALRAKGIQKPLLIIGYTRSRTIIESNLKKIAFTVTALDTLKDIKDVTSMTHIHLKIDTGMHRQGILEEEVQYAIEIIKKNPCIFLEGICTHLSDADNPDETFTEKQITHWNKIVGEFKKTFPDLWYIHASATDGSRFGNDIQGNVMRLGIGLYGLSENESLKKTLNLLPVLEMKTLITGLKMLMRGDTVGYGNTFKADKDMCIATIPVGYYEGLDRRMSSNGFVQAIPQDRARLGDEKGSNDKIACPIIGRVSMNITSIDASALPGVCGLHMGMPVTVISNDPSAPNSIASIAKRCGTITYEIAVKIPAHLKRIVVD